MLIGNLTRDPELRYTPQGTAVCTMGLATNRSWTTDSGEKREETEFHRIVAWNKLAELCSQLLFKGRRVYVEGRLSTRSWTGTDGAQRQATEIVIDDMVILDNKRAEDAGGGYVADEGGSAQMAPIAPSVAEVVAPAVEEAQVEAAPVVKAKKSRAVKAKAEEEVVAPVGDSQGVEPEDIPF